MTPDEFRLHGHALIDWVAAYRERLHALPVMSPLSPGEVAASLPAGPPARGDDLEGLLDDLDQRILPGITHWNHPRFFAYFPSNSSLASVLGELIAAGIGAQTMSWQTSPAAAELEERVLDWLRQMIGLPDDFTGVVQGAGSTATLVALLSARERATGHAHERGGLQEGGPELVVYASDQAHSSVGKAVRLAGLGARALRVVETDEAFALRPDALERAIERDLRQGRVPCAVVATVGTTATTAIDPIREVAGIARAHGAWLHVDAALAGNAMILPELRGWFDGVEQADSIVFNPHKWLGATFDLSAYFVRDPAVLQRVMATDPSYLRTEQDGRVRNYRDWGIPLGRRFRALKLWLVIRDEGVEGLRARLRRDLQYARWLQARAEGADHWHVVAPVPLQTVCLRHAPPDLDPSQIDAHNLAWAERVNRSGAAYLTTAEVRGRRVVRVSFGAVATRWADVEALWERIQAEATPG